MKCHNLKHGTVSPARGRQNKKLGNEDWHGWIPYDITFLMMRHTYYFPWSNCSGDSERGGGGRVKIRIDIRRVPAYISEHICFEDIHSDSFSAYNIVTS